MGMRGLEELWVMGKGGLRLGVRACCGSWGGSGSGEERRIRMMDDG